VQLPGNVVFVLVFLYAAMFADWMLPHVIGYILIFNAIFSARKSA
jgi:hypothetical protein